MRQFLTLQSCIESHETYNSVGSWTRLSWTAYQPSFHRRMYTPQCLERRDYWSATCNRKILKLALQRNQLTKCVWRSTGIGDTEGNPEGDWEQLIDSNRCQLSNRKTNLANSRQCGPCQVDASANFLSLKHRFPIRGASLASIGNSATPMQPVWLDKWFREFECKPHKKVFGSSGMWITDELK